MKQEVRNKYPYQVLLEGSPSSSELEYQFSVDGESKDGIEWWERMTPEQVIREVEEIRDKYSEGSGWVHYDEILDGSESAIQEGHLKISDAQRLMDHIETSLRQSTYLQEQ